MSREQLLVGDRVVNPGEPVVEWCIGGEWTPVCDRDDVPMRAWNDDGRLCCGLCGGTDPEAVRRG